MTVQRLLLAMRLGVALALLAALSWTPADPDLWGHVRFGGDILSAGTLTIDDPYSFTSDRPWINHEWLAEVLMYAAWASAGSAGLILLRLGLTVATLAIVWVELRRLRFTPFVHDALFAVAALGSASQMLQVRPQAFSVLFFAALLSLLGRASTAPRALWLTLPLFALWVNCHGGWIVGAGVLGAWSAVRLTELRGRARFECAGAAVGALASTLINPHGVGMWRFLYETVGLGRADITDWQPAYTDPASFAIWALVLALTAWAFASTKRLPARADLVVIVLLAAMSLRVVRLLAFFSLAVVLRAGPIVASWLRPGGAADLAAPRAPGRLATGALLAGLAIVGTGSIAQTARHVSCVSLAVDWQLPEPEATRFLRDSGASGRLVTWFDWGQYAIWHLSPRLLVSMDGRRETTYSETFRQRHLAFYFDGPQAHDFLQSLDADYVWLPQWLPVVARLPQEGWTPLYSGPRSVIFGRQQMGDRPSARNADARATPSYPAQALPSPNAPARTTPETARWMRALRAWSDAGCFPGP